ncbi:uncharacterized protein LOC119745673 isoform X2 [Patiria miniata]|uniref:Protein sleepless n=1 Tax=Patiria miniata TaxID=46514 RepID=A0A914BR59_PATMI|nr:uncharacterized protein LOC119745673 isoform X2 [Patiria miniata]
MTMDKGIHNVWEVAGDPRQTVSTLKCYTCTNLVASNNNLGVLQSNDACAGATFDPDNVGQKECGTNFGQTAMCEKWEGKFTVNVPLVGNTEISGQVRGCSIVPIGELVDGCAKSTELKDVAKTAVGFITSLFSVDGVEGTYCSCEGRDYCNLAPGLSSAGTMLVVISLVFHQAFMSLVL